MRANHICLTALILVPFWLWSQNLMPPIQNYKSFEYNAASKNWDLSVDLEGELYVANDKGLLHFNGEQWVLYKLPNKTTIRSVAYIGDKIYTGSYEEFGYWKKNDVGLLEYTSLTHLINGHPFSSEEFWQILAFEGSIFFRSFSKIYKYGNDRITVIDPHFVVTNLSIFDNKILAAGGPAGLSWILEDKMAPLKGAEALNDKIIEDMDSTGEGLLIGTKNNGCYVFTNDELKPFEAKINAELKEYQLNKILPLNHGKVAFGTIKNGIYIYDIGHNTCQKLNRGVGLQNNTVLSMLEYKDQLWVGLDNGIDRIQMNNALSYYTDYSGAVGTVYDLAVHEGVIYAGSNTGIYYFQDYDLRFVEGSQGHVWDLEIIEGELFCGHNTGTYKVKKDVLQKVSSISGGYQIVKVPETRSTFLQGTYNGLSKFRKMDNGSWTVSQLNGIDFPIKYLCFEDPKTMWVAHPYKGVYRVKIDDNYNRVLEIQEFGTEAIPNNYNIKLFNIKNQIVLRSEGIWYKYDPIPGEITQFDEFQPYNNKDLIYYDDDYFWFIDNEGSKEVLQTNLKENHFVLDDEQLRKRLAPEGENIIKLNDSIYMFTLIDGFGKLNLSKFQKQVKQFELPTPKLGSFMDEEKKYPLKDTSFSIPNNKAQYITISVSSPSLVQPRYYYELKGTAGQSGNLPGGTLHLQNLPFGNYELAVSTVSINNERSPPLELTLDIAPPWYLSKWSLGVYFLGLIGIVFLVRGFNKRKLERKHSKLREQLQREQAERLAQLEKDELAKEIKLKQKELASTTMNVAKKNELILELKNLLLMNKDKFQNQQRYRSFIKKLNSSINDDEDWRHFEVNFKELHEDFFEVLLERYRSLTPKDLKLCAYLKMNLSSKEIAPLMGITTRGVEIHRYRLRKKLNIDSSRNISNFLITLR